MAFSSFEELAKSRAKWYAASAENGFSEGIERLLTKLYPDKAHFIFELLQNAEDAQATKVEFRLESDALVFIHNGKRLFDLRDVESITSIADSTKRENDGTSIGKFGIGFKAVYSYTETPVIHSGEWHFKISHMVVPEWCEGGDDPQRAQEGKTLFRFPFNKRQKDRSRAYAEILDGLRLLDAESILFLRNISEVRVSCANGEEISIAKSVADHFVDLLRQASGRAGNVKIHRRYLQFSNVIDGLQLEDGSMARSLPIGIAYRLSDQHQHEIVPVTRRNVYVFFPAEKEVSGLRFCIHAPFASTAARDSICDNKDNRSLMSELVRLQVASLEYLRDEGFLTTEFLGALPNSRDEIGSMYEGFRKQLLLAFCNQAYTPKKYGGHAPAKRLCRGLAAFSDLFLDEDLRIIVGRETVSWVQNAHMQNSPADHFLEDLDIEHRGIGDFVEALSRCQGGKKNSSSARILRDVLNTKSNGQLATVYGMMEEYLTDNQYCEDTVAELVADLKGVPMFRTVNDSFASADEGLVTGTACRLVNDGASVQFVHPEITKNLRSPKRERVFAFLNRLGIEPFSEEAMLKLFIERYRSGKERASLSVEDSVARLEDLVRLISQGKIESSIALSFPVLDKSGEYVDVDKTFIDEPYLSTGLSCYARPLERVGVTQLNDIYAQRLSKEGLKRLVANAHILGIKKGSGLLTPQSMRIRCGVSSGTFLEELPFMNSSPIMTYPDLLSL